MFNFFIIFTACFSAIIFHWIIIMFLETRLPVIALFVDKRYYYLCCIHAKVINMRYDKEKEETILEELKEFKFPFFIYPNKKSLEDLSYIKELINQDDLVKRYLFNQEFSYSAFKKLIKEFDTPMEARNRAAQMAIWDILPEPSDERVEKVSGVFVELCTPPFIGSDGNHRISAGENESNVYSAALAAGAIKKECTKTAFVDCIWKMKQIHGEMDVVKGKQGLSNHSDKPLNKDLYEKMKSMFEAVLDQE